MKRSKRNFDLLWRASEIAGKACLSSLLGKTFRGEKALSGENRRLLRGFAWGGQIVSVGIGLKQTGKGDNQAVDGEALCLRFAVRRKVALRRLSAEHRIPSRIRFEHLGRQILTDVVEQDGICGLQSIGPGREAAQNTGPIGTVTAIVNSRSEPDKVFALGCAHVFAPPGLNVPGRAVEAPPDNNPRSLGNVVGSLHSFTDFIDEGTNFVDAALIELHDHPAIRRELPDGSTIGGIVKPDDMLYRTVRMFRGRTGTWTEGMVEALNVTRSIPHGGRGSFAFSGLVESRLYNAGGDSGSPVLLAAEGNPALSMHISGDNVDRAWSVPLDTVLDHFDVEIRS